MGAAVPSPPPHSFAACLMQDRSGSGVPPTPGTTEAAAKGREGDGKGCAAEHGEKGWEGYQERRVREIS